MYKGSNKTYTIIYIYTLCVYLCVRICALVSLNVLNFSWYVNAMITESHVELLV